MSVFTIKNVAPEPREWTSKQGGTFLSYKVDLEEEGGKVALGVEWNRKPESQPPTPGERIAGHLEPGKFAERFKMDFEATKELGSGGAPVVTANKGAAGSTKTWQPESERDPERAARILRQHSQSCAIEALQLAGYPSDGDWDLLKEAIKEWTDWFDTDVTGQTREQGTGGAQGSPPAQPSAPSSGQPDEPSELLHKLDDHLNRAGIEDGREREWLGKAWLGLDKEAQTLSLTMLSMGDTTEQGKALKRLQEIAGPMEVKDDDSGLPF